MNEREMVGKTMTVDRVRELNSKDWFYKILKENPALTGIYPGIENDILEGAIDHHIHAYPDFVYRTQDMIEVCIDAAQAKLGSVPSGAMDQGSGSSESGWSSRRDHLQDENRVGPGSDR